MNYRIIRIIGIILATVGFLLAILVATFDLLTGGGEVGDSQTGAFFISIIILLFGILLVVLSNNSHLKERILAFEALHDDVTYEPEGVVFKGKGLMFLYKRFNTLGMIVTLIGLIFMGLMILKDYEPLLTFNIGSLQMLAIFAGLAITTVGLGIMTLETGVVSNSMATMIRQLKPLISKKVEVQERKPPRMKRAIKRPVLKKDTDIVESAPTIEITPPTIESPLKEYVEPAPAEEYVEAVPAEGPRAEEYVEPVPAEGPRAEEYVEPVQPEEYVEPVPTEGYVEPAPTEEIEEEVPPIETKVEPGPPAPIIEEPGPIGDEISGPPGPGDLPPSLVEETPPIEEPVEEVKAEVSEPEPEETTSVLKSILTEISRLDGEVGEDEDPLVEKDEAAEVPQTCPKCERKLRPHWKSCPYCGLEFR